MISGVGEIHCTMYSQFNDCFLLLLCDIANKGNVIEMTSNKEISSKNARLEFKLKHTRCCQKSYGYAKQKIYIKRG